MLRESIGGLALGSLWSTSIVEQESKVAVLLSFASAFNACVDLSRYHKAGSKSDVSRTLTICFMAGVLHEAQPAV